MKKRFLLVAVLSIAIAVAFMYSKKSNQTGEVEMVSIDKITMAVTDMQKMVDFYTATFGVEFKALDLYNSTLYTCTLGNMELLLCPKEIAQVDANINTVQLRFVVDDVEKAFKNGLESGGKLLNAPQEQGGLRIAALRDPDNNSLELIDRMN